MKRGWKIFWIVSLIMFCLGIALCAAGFTLGATWEMVGGSSPEWINFGNSFVYKAEEQSVPADVSEQSFTGVHSIEVDAEIIELQILVSDEEDSVRVELEDEDLSTKIDCSQDGSELVIQTNSRFKINGIAGKLCLYVPETYLEEVEINVEAGTVYIEKILAKNLTLNVEAGEAVIDSFTAKETDFECGAGRIEAYGNAEKELEVNCGAGEVVVGIAGNKTDYNYQVECGIGEVIIGNESHSGLGSTERHSNGASKEMNIECGIGSITVDFENE